MTEPLSGFVAQKRVVQLPSGGWQVTMEPDDDWAKEFMADAILVGYGDTEDEATREAMAAFAVALDRLDDVQRALIERKPVEEDATLVGGVDGTGEWFDPGDGQTED